MNAQLIHFQNCEKLRINPNHHLKFTKVEEFTIEMLPVTFQDERLERLLQLLRQLTVKLSVRRVNSPLVKSGSGIIVNVHDKLVKILTAKHVLGDDFQAQNSRAIVGFDRQEFAGYSTSEILIDEDDPENDWCFVHSKIENEIEQFDEIAKIVQELRNVLDIQARYKYLRDKDKLCLIFSHPHGCFKHVSIGTLVGFDEPNEDDEELERFDRLMYNTPTCNGSSGAFILALGSDDLQVHSRRKKFGEDAFNLSSGPIKAEKIHIE